MLTGSYNRKIDDYNAVVYMYVSAQSGTLDQEQVTIKYPNVTLSLAGVPSTHTGATMVFPSGNNQTTTFNFAAGATTAKADIGAAKNGVFDEGFLGIGAGVTTWPVLYPAGKQTVNQITVNHNNIAFTVTLENAITINNPLIPPYVDFKINDSTYTGTIPSRTYSTDGETITITLPSLPNWSYDTSSSKSGEFAETGNTLTATVHTTASASLGRTKYTQYTETRKEYQAVSSTTYWTVTKEIIGWKVGNTTYKPGDTVTITGTQTITAVIKATDGAKTTKDTIATKYYVTYAATGKSNTGWSKPSGYGDKVSSTAAHWTDPTYS